jgi:hypothetical protein
MKQAHRPVSQCVYAAREHAVIRYGYEKRG